MFMRLYLLVVALTLPLMCASQSQAADVVWTKQSPNVTYPGVTGFTSIHYDPVSHKIIVPSVPVGSGSIYASLWYAYDPLSNQFTFINGDGSSAAFQGCSADKPNQPGNRHPYGQIAIDPVRNYLWFGYGANQGCELGTTVNTNGTAVTWTGGVLFAGPGNNWVGEVVTIGGVDYTVASIADREHLTLTTPANPAVQTGSKLYLKSRYIGSNFYHMTLNPNVADDIWTREATLKGPGSVISSGMVVDPVSDVLFWYGEKMNSLSVYCPSTTSLTTVQQGAGCATPNEWTHITPKNGRADANGTAITRVSGDSFNILVPNDVIAIVDGYYQIASIQDGDHLTLATSPPTGFRPNQEWYTLPSSPQAPPAMFYDSVTKKIILFGGTSQNGASVYNLTWAYDVPTRRWVRKALATAAPPFELVDSVGTPSPTNPRKLLAQPEAAYNSINHTIYYHQVAGSGAQADWQYDPSADTWTKLTSSGGGPFRDASMAFHADCNCLVAYTNVGGTGSLPEMWIGTLNPPANAAPSITLQPADKAVLENQSATFVVLVSGYPAPSYQWQSKAAGAANFTNITGANSNSYVKTNIPVSASGTQFRCVITNSQGNVTSNPGTLTVTPMDTTAPSAPTSLRINQ